MSNLVTFIIGQTQAQTFVGLLLLIAVFFYVGLITIGGGQVAITIMQEVIVERFALLPASDFFNMVAISESTPGPIGINIATYIGTELYGWAGGIFTTLGEVMPSIICIMLIARFFGKFSEKKIVKAAFSTLRPAVSGVIAVAAVKIIVLALVVTSGFDLRHISTWNEFCFSGLSTVFYFLCLIVLFKTKLHPVFIILAGGVFGAFFLQS
ncbi:MAG: chromate transporter [Treponema sp.]|nr:chromate transporter [Treponema sp.]